MKCKEYATFSPLCQQCDIHDTVPCCNEFDFNIPKKYVRVERTDHMKTSWNECPTCGNPIGYHPKEEDFKCKKCGQKIAW